LRPSSLVPAVPQFRRYVWDLSYSLRSELCSCLFLGLVGFPGLSEHLDDTDWQVDQMWRGHSCLPRRDSSRRFSDPVRNTAKADRRCPENSPICHPSHPRMVAPQNVVPNRPQPDLHTLPETEQSAPSPAPQRSRIRRPGGILAMRSGPLPIAASADCLPGFMPAVQRVVTIGGRPTGQNGEGLATQSAEPPAAPRSNLAVRHAPACAVSRDR
jgi:hypothetical protein